MLKMKSLELFSDEKEGVDLAGVLEAPQYYAHIVILPGQWIVKEFSVQQAL